jgi:hypothetical protein
MKTVKNITFEPPCLATDYIHWAELGQPQLAQVEIEYEYDPGEREEIRAAPEDCHEGEPASVTIKSVKLAKPCLLPGEKCLVFLNTGFDLTECFDPHYIGKLRDEIHTEIEKTALGFRLHGAAALQI